MAEASDGFTQLKEACGDLTKLKELLNWVDL